MSYILAKFSDPAVETKVRHVDVYKNLVYKDVELYTFKHVDASGAQDEIVRDAVAADPSEKIDSAVVARFVAFREAKLRMLIQKYLTDEPQAYSDDGLTLADERFRFWLELPSSFKDALLQSLAEYMHRFLVFGALFDWYSQLGMMKQASVYGLQLEDLEDDIKSMLGGGSIVKRPLQPFGPAYRIK